MRFYWRSVIPVLFVLAACTGRDKPAEGNTQEPDGYVTTCAYDNPASALGEGLVIAGLRFSVYRDSALTELMFNADFTNGETPDICPRFFKPDYGILHFACLQAGRDFYQVLIDSVATGYMPAMAGKFLTWDEYILNGMGVRRIDPTEGETRALRTEPDPNARALEIPQGHELFCPTEVLGDWVKVTYDCQLNLTDNPHEGEPCHAYVHECNNPITGWLRWREGERLLIDVLLMA